MDAARLRSVPLFSSLSERERERVPRWAEEVDVEAGRPLIGQGRIGWEFFVIEEGTADVSVDGQARGELGPGDFFGEIALLEESRRRTASVVARTPMTLIVMNGRDFRYMAREMPGVAERVRDAIRRRIEQRGEG